MATHRRDGTPNRHRGDCAGADRFELGKLPVGWYRIGLCDSDNKEREWTTAAVLAPLAAPTPQDSPICVDSATAWFAKDDPAEQENPRPDWPPWQAPTGSATASAGATSNRQRDEFATADTTYDTSARIQNRYGLKVLQVFHDTPPWAAGQNSRGRFPHRPPPRPIASPRP